MIDRRGLISGGAAAMAAVSVAGKAAAQGAPQVAPKGFLWGSAGAAYQIEGGNYASDLWILEHMKPSIFATPSGDADDSYNRIDEDIALAASFGFNAHRLSIEWSRIEPEQGQISYAALAYYRRVLEKLHAHGMAPVVTFIHTTVPRWFAANGGFMTPDGIAPFASYCRLITEHMGDLITASATFNEPNINALLSWEPTMRNLGPQLEMMRKGVAAQLGNPKWASPLLGDFHIQQPIMIEAHSRAYDAVKTASKGAFPVGVTLALNHDAPPPNGDMTGVLLKRSQVLTPWISAPGDFVGVQNYTRSIVGPDANIPETGVPVTQMGYPYAPESLEKVIRMVVAQAKRPVYVTENGIGTEDDTQRIAFIKVAVQGVMNCLADGLDVRGYLHWSLLDNWEWTSGYRPKFGLVAVDRQTFARTPKPSASYYGQIAKAGRVV